MQTLNIFLESVKKTFGDPDRAEMAHAQLHKLKMTSSTTAEDNMARFEMLMGRTGFNDAALKDIYIWGLPNSILQFEYPNRLALTPVWLCKVHNSIAVYAAMVSLFYSLCVTEAL